MYLSVFMREIEGFVLKCLNVHMLVVSLGVLALFVNMILSPFRPITFSPGERTRGPQASGSWHPWKRE